MIPIQFEDVELKAAMTLVAKHMIYAYDAYMVICAKDFKIPLLTLDLRMAEVAKNENVRVLEV